MGATETKLLSNRRSIQENEKKWGEPLLKAGWTAIPNIIFLKQQELGLDSMDINILLVLISHWWYAENKPFPSKKTIAETINCDPSTVRRRIAKMQEKGLIERIARYHNNNRSETNIYDFSGLVAEATILANAALIEREKKDNRTKRKRNSPLKAEEEKT